LSRLEKIRIYRKRYRKSKEGREEHQDTERNRRRRQTLGEKTVGDQSSAVALRSATVSALMRMAAMSAVIGRVGQEEAEDGKVYCEFCGRPGVFVRFGWKLGRTKAQGGFPRTNL
jgi:hypothetical protein